MLQKDKHLWKSHPTDKKEGNSFLQESDTTPTVAVLFLVLCVLLFSCLRLFNSCQNSSKLTTAVSQDYITRPPKPLVLLYHFLYIIAVDLQQLNLCSGSYSVGVAGCGFSACAVLHSLYWFCCPWRHCPASASSTHWALLPRRAHPASFTLRVDPQPPYPHLLWISSLRLKSSAPWPLTPDPLPSAPSIRDSPESPPYLPTSQSHYFFPGNRKRGEGWMRLRTAPSIVHH